jgi:hypothetical protein
MTHYLKAFYEDGVFRPLGPVQIAEHPAVLSLVETPDEPRDEADTDLPIWEFAAQLMRDVPEDVLQALPSDGASQHDHYLYGAP